MSVPRGRGTKTRAALNALLSRVRRGAEGPSVLVVLALAPSEKEGFTHLVGQLRTSHCTKQRDGGVGGGGGGDGGPYRLGRV